MMKIVASFAVLLVAVCYLETASAQLEVTVKQEDYNRGALNRFCCFIAQSMCTSQCAGQDCAATCTGRCGFLGLFTCGPYTCSGIAANTCTTTTTTTTAAPTTAAATTAAPTTAGR
eukprot:TRINITY_DN51_c0_g2_i1.p2 TRINITY_DN51_c0_g2~~TRINITY_DN51_c0_g2_i1.p2  ORF type:complete len:124 (-),score=45.27 TRINITY_DN51_c0_g2_i1:85-432(-)